MMSLFNPQTVDPKAPGHGAFVSVEELYLEGQRSAHETLHLRRHVESTRGGLKRSSIRSRGMEFFESRPYVPQDEMRSIDWKVSARKNALYTKIFIEEKDRPIFVAIDLRSHMFFGTRRVFKSVLAAKLAARLAFAAQNGGDRIGAFILSDSGIFECPKGSSKKSMALLLGRIASATKALKEVEHKPQADYWPTAFLQMSNRVDSGAVLFLISDFLGLTDRARSLLYRVRKRADVFTLSLSDPLEERLPSLGMVGMRSGEELIYFDSSSPDLERRYRAWFLSEREGHLRLFRSLNIPNIAFSTAEDMDSGLRRIFGGRW